MEMGMLSSWLRARRPSFAFLQGRETQRRVSALPRDVERKHQSDTHTHTQQPGGREKAETAKLARKHEGKRKENKAAPVSSEFVRVRLVNSEPIQLDLLL